jgi:hypothetical protein
MISGYYSKWQTETHFNTYQILKKDTYTANYFEGYPNELCYNISYWNPTFAAKAAGFIT